MKKIATKKGARAMNKPTRAPYDKIPKHLRSEESAVIQMLYDVFGWRVADMPKEQDRFSYWHNLTRGKGGTARVLRLVVPTTSAIAVYMDQQTKQAKKNAARRKRLLGKRDKKQRTKRPRAPFRYVPRKHVNPKMFKGHVVIP